MPKKTNKWSRVWVTKNSEMSYRGGFEYEIYFKKPSKKLLVHMGFWLCSDAFFWQEEFEDRFFKLKPGAGPVKCEMEIRRVK